MYEAMLPDTARRNERGHLEVGGCDLVSLAQEFGTPLYVYDEATIRDLARAYRNTLARLLPESEVAYAGKAFLCRAICELVEEERLSLDVCTGGELWIAKTAGFPLERVFMHGNNKSEAELRLGLELGVGCIVVDSLDELALLSRLAGELDVVQRVLLRIAPGVTPETHKHNQTGGDGSKFGLSVVDDTAATAVRAAMGDPGLDVYGLHAHIGSQIIDVSTCYADEIAVLARCAREWRDVYGFECRALDIGGGLGIAYEESDQATGPAEWAALVAGHLTKQARRQDLYLPRLIVEPGRSIVGRAGVTVYRVGFMKTQPGLPLYVAVDGGESDNIRPALNGSMHAPLLADRADGEEVEAAVVGKHCDSGDFLVRSCRLPRPRPGEVLVTLNTGAYAFSLSNNFNAVPRPAAVFVKDGDARLVIERETWDDLVRRQRSLHGGTARVQ